jgi:hypothetical protein
MSKLAKIVKSHIRKGPHQGVNVIGVPQVAQRALGRHLRSWRLVDEKHIGFRKETKKKKVKGNCLIG